MTDPRRSTAAKDWFFRLSPLITVLIVAAIGGAFVKTVDLTPRVGGDFFFSSKDPAVAQVQWIERNFPSGGGQVIFLSVASPEIKTNANAYVEVIRGISDEVGVLPGVTGVISATHGPKRPKDVLEGPMWSRVLVDNELEASLVLVLTGKQVPRPLIPALERTAAKWSKGPRKVRISGTPYVSELIGRHLKEDFRTFTLASFAVFGLGILLVFRSLPVFLGTLVTCGAAIMLSLIVQALLGGSIGILTANLATIVFVLTLSHIIFLTANQRSISSSGSRRATEGSPLEAVRRTLPASFWCMLTTLLGFASLLLVEAEPLRELGRGGTLGTALAIVCAYAFYPPFLGAAGRSWARTRGAERELGWLRRLFARPMVSAAIVLTFVAGLLGGSISVLDTDPPLLRYFSPEGDIYDGLEFIDRTGGTSLLQVVVRDPNGGKLDTGEAYERLWSFQNRLEDIPAVGASISLPVLIAEGRAQSRLARLIGQRRLLNLLASPKRGAIADAFVTEDRKNAMYLMRMREAERELPRSMIIGH
ncbi:MAG: MMPL family transporter, partial [Deltaproteobacteria bacterium]